MLDAPENCPAIRQFEGWRLCGTNKRANNESMRRAAPMPSSERNNAKNAKGGTHLRDACRMWHPCNVGRHQIPENSSTKLSFAPPLYDGSNESSAIGKSAEFVLPTTTILR